MKNRVVKRRPNQSGEGPIWVIPIVGIKERMIDAVNTFITPIRSVNLPTRGAEKTIETPPRRKIQVICIWVKPTLRIMCGEMKGMMMKWPRTRIIPKTKAFTWLGSRIKRLTVRLTVGLSSISCLWKLILGNFQKSRTNIKMPNSPRQINGTLQVKVAAR